MWPGKHTGGPFIIFKQPKAGPSNIKENKILEHKKMGNTTTWTNRRRRYDKSEVIVTLYTKTKPKAKEKA